MGVLVLQDTVTISIPAQSTPAPLGRAVAVLLLGTLIFLDAVSTQQHLKLLFLYLRIVVPHVPNRDTYGCHAATSMPSVKKMSVNLSIVQLV